MNVRCFIGAALVGVIALAATAHAETRLSGDAFGVFVDAEVNELGVGIDPTPHVILPPQGGMEEDEWQKFEVDDTVTSKTLHVSTMGKLAGNNAFVHSSALVEDVDLLNGLITADAVVANAKSHGHTDRGQQKSTHLGSEGDGRLFGLVIAGKVMGDVSPPPNTQIDLELLGVRIVLNEQIEGGDGVSSTTMTVNMIHVTVYEDLLGTEIASEIIVSSAHSGVDFAPSGDDDVLGFVTGGGWIGSHPDIATFGFVAGNKRSGLHGSLQYIDHSDGLNVHMHSVDSFGIDDEGCAKFSGPVRVNGSDGFTAYVEVCDLGEPGAENDYFAITVVNSKDQIIHENDGLLGGGNIQMHAR